MPTVTVSISSITNKRFFDIGSEIDELGRLPAGWCYGEGVPIPKSILYRAKQVAYLGVELGLPVSAFPGLDGSASLAFYGIRDTLQIEVNQDGTVDLSLERGYGFDFEVVLEDKNVSLARLENELTLLSWNTFVQSTHGSLIEIQVVYTVVGAAIQELGGRYSNGTVPSSDPVRSASTSDFTIAI